MSQNNSSKRERMYEASDGGAPKNRSCHTKNLFLNESFLNGSILENVCLFVLRVLGSGMPVA